jgi:hypothetical protein
MSGSACFRNFLSDGLFRVGDVDPSGSATRSSTRFDVSCVKPSDYFTRELIYYYMNFSCKESYGQNELR